jgi:hypothetical protein
VLFIVTASGPAAASSAAGNAALLVPPAASHDSQMFTASATVPLHDGQAIENGQQSRHLPERLRNRLLGTITKHSPGASIELLMISKAWQAGQSSPSQQALPYKLLFASMQAWHVCGLALSMVGTLKHHAPVSAVTVGKLHILLLPHLAAASPWAVVSTCTRAYHRQAQHSELSRCTSPGGPHMQAARIDCASNTVSILLTQENSQAVFGPPSEWVALQQRAQRT